MTHGERPEPEDQALSRRQGQQGANLNRSMTKHLGGADRIGPHRAARLETGEARFSVPDSDTDPGCVLPPNSPAFLDGREARPPPQTGAQTMTLRSALLRENPQVRGPFQSLDGVAGSPVIPQFSRRPFGRSLSDK